MITDYDDDFLDEQEDDEPNYCATCSYAGRCAGYCSVPPDTMSRYPLRNGRNPFLYLGGDDE